MEGQCSALIESDTFLVEIILSALTILSTHHSQSTLSISVVSCTPSPLSKGTFFSKGSEQGTHTCRTHRSQHVTCDPGSVGLIDCCSTGFTSCVMVPQQVAYALNQQAVYDGIIREHGSGSQVGEVEVDTSYYCTQ